MSIKPVLSVITVVYNNAAHIEQTLCSVLEQSYSVIEYIVIDGQSTDGTLPIIEKYKARLSYFVSEPDKGIYDAMNKGLAAATGDYVIFMNSGDAFFSTDTVEKVFASNTDADIYYGETEMITEDGQSLGRRRHKAPAVLNWRGFKFGMSISHQAIYIKLSLVEPYDPRYQLSADIDWIIKAAKKAAVIVNVNSYVAKYRVGGMSKLKHRKSLEERFQIMRHYYGLIPTIVYHIVIAFNLIGYYLLYRKTND